MTRRRRRTRASDSEEFLGIVAVAAGVFFLNEEWAWFAVFCVSGPLVWWLFAQDTDCGVWLEDKGRGCALPVRGRLTACYLPRHKRMRQNEIRAALGIPTKPDQRPARQRANGGRRTSVPARPAPGAEAPGRVDRLTVLAAATSIPASIATVVATVIQVMAQT